MAIFDTGIIDLEGGYSDDPEDHGGATKYGITQRDYPHLDIKNLTVDQAIEIYKRDIWNPNNLGWIDNQIAANLIFRLIVNSGRTEGVDITQRALNSMGCNLTIDGILGPITYNAINSVNSDWLIDAIRVSECRFYLQIVTNNETQKRFFEGWIRRALS